MIRTASNPTRVRTASVARDVSGLTRFVVAVLIVGSLGAALGQEPSPDIVDVVLDAEVPSSSLNEVSAPENLAANVALALAAALADEEQLDTERYQPMPMPQFDPSAVTRTAVAAGLARFDHDTGRETRVETGSLEILPPADDDDPGALPDESQQLLPQAFSPLQRVARPWDNGTYRRHVKLFFEVPGAGSFECSGTLIDSQHVLTAGHCLYDFDTQQWSREVIVVPAFEDGHAPFHTARGTTSWAWSGWMYNRDFNHDVGLLRLNRPVGGVTGWQGYGGVPTFTGGPGFEANRCLLVPRHGNPLEVPGYPADGAYAPGLHMYTHTGTWDGCPDYRPWYYGPAIPGQSGSGVMTSDRIAFAIMTHGYADGRGGHTLVTVPKFNDMLAQIRDVTPTSFDLVPLFVRTTNDVYTAGQRLTGLSFRLHNLSTQAHEGDVRIEVFLVDAERGTSRAIGTHDLTLRFGAKGTGRISTDVMVIPRDLPSGTYHVVVEAHSAADSNHSNNRTMPPDTGRIRVLAAAEPDPEPEPEPDPQPDPDPVAPTLVISAQPAAQLEPRVGDRDVVVMHLEAGPPDAGPAVTLTSLRLGAIDLHAAPEATSVVTSIFDGVRVYHDPTGRGTLDGATELAFAGGFDARGDASLKLDQTLTVAAGEQATLLITVDVTTPSAGQATLTETATVPGMPIGIGIGTLALGFCRRRNLSEFTRRMVLLAVVITPLLVACKPPPPLPLQYAFGTELRGVEAVADDAAVAVANLPIQGSVVRLSVRQSRVGGDFAIHRDRPHRRRIASRARPHDRPCPRRWPRWPMMGHASEDPRRCAGRRGQSHPAQTLVAARVPGDGGASEPATGCGVVLPDGCRSSR